VTGFAGVDGDIAAELDQLRRLAKGKSPLPVPSGLGLIATLGLIAGFCGVAIFVVTASDDVLSEAGRLFFVALLLTGAVAAMLLFASAAVERDRHIRAEERLTRALAEPTITWKHFRLAIRECIYGHTNLTPEDAEKATDAILAELILHRKEMISLLRQQGDLLP